MGMIMNFLFQNGNKMVEPEPKNKKELVVIKALQNYKTEIINFSVFILVTAYFVCATKFYIENNGNYLEIFLHSILFY